MLPIPPIANIKLVIAEIRRIERMRQPDGTPQRVIVAVYLRAAVITQLEFPGLVEISYHPATDRDLRVKQASTA